MPRKNACERRPPNREPVAFDEWGEPIYPGDTVIATEEVDGEIVVRLVVVGVDGEPMP